jgi:hypothetical protein
MNGLSMPLVLAQTTAGTIAVLGMLALVVAWLLFRSHRYFSRVQRRTVTPFVPPSPEPAERGHHLEAPEGMVRWEIEMHDLARELSGKLDSKMGVLEHLIGEADRAAARLERALEASRSGQQKSTPAERSQSANPAQPLNDPVHASQADALKAIDGKPPSRDRSDRETARLPSARQRQQEIYTLADYGYDAVEIARRVGSPVGEVELVLGLRTEQPRRVE